MVCGKGDISEIRRGGRKFVGLGLSNQPGGYSERIISEDSCPEEGTGARKAIALYRVALALLEVYP